MSAAWNKRQCLFINRPLQGRVIATVAWYWCVYHIALWHAMFLFYYLKYRRELAAGGPLQTFDDLYSNFAAENIAVIVCAALVLPIVLWDVLKLTHRFVGPLVRFTSAFRQLARGENIRRVQLRRGDFLVGLQDAMNEYLASPYAPRQALPTDMHNQHDPLTADLATILGDMREIQASLCRVYTPATDASELPASLALELQNLAATDPCNQGRLDREIARTRKQESEPVISNAAPEAARVSQ